MTTHVRRIGVAALAVVLLIGAGWYFALWSPQSRNLSSAHKAHAAAEGQISQLQSQRAQLQALVRQIPADRAKLATARAAIPDTPALDSALQQIHQTAVSTGVSVTSVGPSVPAGSATTAGPAAAAQATGQAASGAPAVTLILTAAGAESQLKAFVSQLTNLSQTHRVFVVDHIQFSGAASLTASMSVRVFYAGQPTP